MRDNRELFNRALADPASVDPKDVGILLDRYPFARVLQIASQRGSTMDAGIAAEPGAQPSADTPGGIDAHTDAGTDVGDMTVYHDEHLPYSFLWWLNKTRLDYAHTYKPYAPVQRKGDGSEDSGRGLLDQQIRENIFHLLEPEEKLSVGPISTGERDIPFEIPKRTDPIIDRFIQEDPKISPPRPENLSFENKARKSASDQASVVTETLAKIYTEQGLYPKAIEVYEKLSLKYPEKSGYFADRIAELQTRLS